MKNLMLATVTAVLVLAIGSTCPGQAKRLITATSAGPIKNGMSIAEVRKAAKPMKIDDGENVFEGDTVYRVTGGKKLVMTFWEIKMSSPGIVAGIEVVDPSYRTAKGAHVGTSLTDLVRMYGKLTSIEYFDGAGNGPEGEFATFARQPKGISFQVAVRAKGKMAGVYPKGLAGADLEGHPTKKYNRGVYLKMISVGRE